MAPQMSGNSDTVAFREPPEGVVSGDTVPPENDMDEMKQSLIEEAVTLLRTKPGYSDKSEDELREIIKEKV